MLQGSSHFDELQTNPGNYGDVLGPSDQLKPGKFHILIGADTTRQQIVQLAPAAFTSVLTAQKNIDPSVRILDASGDVLALVGGSVLKSEEMPVRLLHSLETNHAIESVAFSRDGTLVATAEAGARLWNVASGRQVKVLRCSSNALAFSSDSKTLATGGLDGQIKIWDFASGRDIRSFGSGTGIVESVAFSPDGNNLASGGTDGLPQLWDVSSGKLVRNFIGNRASSTVSDIAFSPNGKLIAIASFNAGMVMIWNAANGKPVNSFIGAQDEYINSVVFSPDSSKVAATGSDECVRVWEISSGKLFGTFSHSSRGVFGLAFHPGGKLIASGGADKVVRVWDVAAGKEQAALWEHSDCIRSVAFSPDGKTMASGGYENGSKLWAVNL